MVRAVIKDCGNLCWVPRLLGRNYDDLLLLKAQRTVKITMNVLVEVIDLCREQFIPSFIACHVYSSSWHELSSGRIIVSNNI